MALLHSQPQHQQASRSSTPPLSNLFRQGSTGGSTGSGISGGTGGACGGVAGWCSGGAMGGSVEEAAGGDSVWAAEDFTEIGGVPGGHFGMGGATGGSLGGTLGESQRGIGEGPVGGGSRGSIGGVSCGSMGDATKRAVVGVSGGTIGKASRESIVGTLGGSLGRASGGSLGAVSGGSIGGASGELVEGNTSGFLRRASGGSPTSHIGGTLSGSVGRVGGHIGGLAGGPVGSHMGGATACQGGASGGITAGVISSSLCGSPVSYGSSSPMPGQLPHSQPPPKPPQVGPLQQFAGGGRTTTGLDLFHSPPQGSPSLSRGQQSQQPAEVSPSSLSHFSLANLQSGFLPHQMSLERSALASLAQYGSGNASPCLTPLAPSPTIQSPVAGRTFHYSDPSSAADSHSSLLMPQSSLHSHLPSQPHAAGRDSPLGRFSEDLKLLSSSHPSLPQEVAQTLGHLAPCASGETGCYPSPFSSPTLVPKPCSSVSGHMTPPVQMPLGHPHQTPSSGDSPALLLRRDSAAYSSDLEPQTVRSKLPSNL